MPDYLRFKNSKVFADTEAPGVGETSRVYAPAPVLTYHINKTRKLYSRITQKSLL
jgi:hypothetical protein